MAGIKERLIQVILRGKDLLSPEAKKGRAALDDLRESGEKLRTELDKAKEQNNLVRSLAALEKESDRAERTAERTAKKVEELRGELDKNPSSKGLSQSLTIAERESAKAEKALDKLKQEASHYAKQAKAAGIDTSKLSEEEKRLASELNTAKGAVSKNTKATKDLEREQRQAARSAAEQASKNTSLGNALKTAENKILAYAGAYVSLQAASRLAGKALDLVRSGIESVISVGDGAEKAKIQLEGLMGSIEGGEKATAWIEEFADKSGQRINDVKEAFAELKAYGLDPMDGSMQAIMDKTAQLGGETEKLKGISLAVGQMWAKEKIVQEEVNQLRERGVNAFELLSKAMNKNVSELQDMAAAGELGRNEIKLLIDEMGRSAEGQAARALETLSGKWNVLVNQFQKFGEDVASHGAMDVVKEKLQGVLDKVIELSDDGTLNNLAEALSEAFVVGIEEVEKFVGSLSKIDFKELIQSGTEWLKNFGSNIDDAMTRVQLFFAPFKTLFNLIQSGFAATGAFVLSLTDVVLSGVQKIGSLLPEALGGKKLEQSMINMRTTVKGVFDDLADHILENNDDIADAWDISTDKYEDNQTQQADAAKQAEREKQAALKETEAGIDALFAKEEQAAEAYRIAAVEGKRAIESMADAMQLIDSTESVAELEKLRKRLLKTYQDGRISQEEFQQSTGVLSGKLKDTGKAAAESGRDLKSLDGVIEAISKSVNQIDTRAAKAALDKLYREGKIDADEHAKAQDQLNKKVAELKPAADESAKAVKEIKEVSSGASAAVMGVGEAADSASVSLSFFDVVLSAARTPLAALGKAALAAFDALGGLAKSKPEIDTSSIEKTKESLKMVRSSVASLQEQLAAPFSSGFSKWANVTLLNSASIQRSFLNQKLALQQLMDGYEKGTVTVSHLSDAAANAKSKFNLLNEADLGQLTSTLRSAQQQMDQLANSTKSTLQSLRTELLELTGTNEEIEKARMDARRQDLQAQLLEAQKLGEKEVVNNLKESLKTLSEIERVASNRREAEARARAESERERNKETKPDNTAAESLARRQQQEAAAAKLAADNARAAQSFKQQQPSKIIQLQLGNQSASLGVDSADDEAALLSILEQAGLRSR